ncbi:MAG: acetamidase/formamidase family protein [SAR202 cluster bacterium]|nr:acetamidase/formamidase family protein [SAR202 cluster bacterium]
MKSIEIMRKKRLFEDSGTGHNRWHPDIPPILEVEQNEEVILPTRDALDGQFSPKTTIDDFSDLDANAVHPLTGPVFIKGAEPGDLLEIEFLDVLPDSWAFTCIVPGLGFLRDLFHDPYMVHWKIEDEIATSPQLPGVRIPGAPFLGISGVAPSHHELSRWIKREQDLMDRGGLVFPPEINGAVPSFPPVSSEGLRTIPPRENGGNLDVKQLSRGSKLYLPVLVDGALFSAGDAHFAQGDGEVCVTAVEMSATAELRFRVHKGEAAKGNIVGPVFQGSKSNLDIPQNFTATVGMPIDDEGKNLGEDLTLAARNALLAMIRLLELRGWTRQQAYVICSVAVDLRVSNAVDVPNYVVSAILPESIFNDG